MTSPSMSCTEAEHAAHLQNLMQIACKYDLVFNPQKTHVKVSSCQFLWMPLQCQWYSPRPGKVQCHTCLTSANKCHQTPGVLKPSHVPQSLRPWVCPPWLLPCMSCSRRTQTFTWNCIYDAAFQHVKEAVISDTTLRYFNPSLPVTIQVDAWQVGLGAAFLQNSKPVAFASKALSNTKCQYANIEREMLAVGFRAERFQMYIYGRSFSYWVRPQAPGIYLPEEPGRHTSPSAVLATVPPGLWLHHPLLHPGKEMALPDTLSQFSPHPEPDILLDIAIHHACLSTEIEGSIPTSLHEWSQDAHPSPTSSSLVGPDDIKAVPHPLCPNWQHHETLIVEDGLVLHGEALIVPPSERERVLQQIHQFHQEITKAQLFAHGCVFWPGINKAIEEAVWQCETCTQFQAQNAAASLTPTPTPSHPWQMCTTDIFTLVGINYLICGNFYSKMILIWCLPSGQSNTVKVCLATQRNVLRAQNSQSTLLWQWPSVWECTVHWVLHLLGYHAQDLKPPLLCIWMDLQRHMHKICEACTPMH